MSERSASTISLVAVAAAALSAAVLFATGQTAVGGSALALAVLFLGAGGYVRMVDTRRVVRTGNAQARNLRQIRKMLVEGETQRRAFESSIVSRMASLEDQISQKLSVWESVSGTAVENRRAVESLGGELTRVERVSRQTRSLVKRIQTELGEIPYHTAELQRLYAQLVPDQRRMPPLGGWALTTGTLLQLVDDVLSNQSRAVVVECGSGTSTAWLALALEARGGDGSVIALESDPTFAAQTRHHLERLGVSHRARVVDAGLVATTLGNHVAQPWYDIAQAGLPDRIDVLFVDGPIGSLGEIVRFPAYPLMADRLADGALVVLDDTDRADEKKIVELWTREAVSGCRLEKVRATDRATIMQARRQD